MNLRQLEEIGEKQGCFSLQQLQLYEPDFLRSNLTRWTKNGYIKRISKGWYCINSNKIDENLLFFFSNIIYTPSYVSMESALRYYNLIPEGVFMTTACSTKKTQELKGDLGNFYYYHIKPSLFWGYSLIENKYGKPFLIASIEKTLCDFFYLKSKLRKRDIPDLRIDIHNLLEISDSNKILNCAKKYQNKRLEKIITNFISYIDKNA